MIDEHYIKARKNFKDNGKICDQHVWSHYIGKESLKYTAVCLVCSKVMNKDEWQKYLEGS